MSFRYRNAKTGRMDVRTVSGADFLWLVVQHVLPKGFRRARNFGFLHPNCKRLIALLQVLLKFVPGPTTTWIRERADPVHLLRGGDADREDADSGGVLRGDTGADCRAGGALTM